MKKIVMLCFVATAMYFSGCATSNTASNADNNDRYQTEEQLANSKLNNRRLEKNLDRYAAELNLSKRQQKQFKKIDKRYNRLERKLSRNDDAKRRDRKRLAEEKRIEMIAVLSPDQQQKLEALAKKNRFSLDQFFGK
jgi:Spy/CpxP family protein refolding chaperone